MSSRDHARRDAAVLGAWYATAGEAPDVDAIRMRARCAPSVARAVFVIRLMASPTLVTLWTSGALTLSQLWRALLAGDEREQLEEARAASPAVRRQVPEAP